MKLCTFTRDLLPIRAGETRIYPDEVVAKLEAVGAIAAQPPDWPAKPPPTPSPRERRRTYLTK